MSKKLASPIAFRQPLEGGWELLFELTLSDRMEVRTRLLRHGRIATKREEELWRDTTPFVMPILVKELSGAVGEEKIPAKLQEWIDQYKKATSLCRSREASPERMNGARFFEFWRLDSKFLSPLLIALSELNSEFVRGVAEAMETLSNRICSSKDRSGEDLDRWLLAYKLRIGDRKVHTVRELNEQFVSKFRSISDKKLRERCRKLNVALKDDVRGAGAVRRKRSNGTAYAAKRANRSD